MSRSEALRKELKASLWPYFERAGFARGKASSLFTPFSRTAGDAIHVFNVQWDKHHRPRFIINFGEIPASRLPRIPADDLRSMDLVHHSQSMLRLKRAGGGTMGSWFQLRRPLWSSLTTLSWTYSPAEVVAQVVAAFPEVEAWWSTKQVGPHVALVATSVEHEA